MPELVVSTRLQKLLDPLTADEKKQLKANILTDGGVKDPIQFWNDGKQNVIVDGMHRWSIILKLPGVDYRTEEKFFDSYEEAEIWILDHQLGRRNAKPTALRKQRGLLYNRLKKGRGGPKCQNDTLGDAAERVAKKTGVSVSTVKRDGARVEALESLTKAAQKQVADATDADIKKVAKLSSADQDRVARALRVGDAGNVREAIKVTGAKPKDKPKPKPKKQFDRSHWAKQWHKAVGPLVRLTDKIANEVGEKHGADHKAVKKALETAAQRITKWMEG